MSQDQSGLNPGTGGLGKCSRSYMIAYFFKDLFTINQMGLQMIRWVQDRSVVWISECKIFAIILRIAKLLGGQSALCSYPLMPLNSLTLPPPNLIMVTVRTLGLEIYPISR